LGSSVTAAGFVVAAWLCYFAWQAIIPAIAV
jgi:hypothetical protein